MHSARLAFAAFLALAPVTHAQQTAPKALILVRPGAKGAIDVPLGPDWSPTGLFLYDQGTRPVAQLSSKQSGATVSYILFPNGSGTATAEGCREDAINPILKKLQASMVVTRIKRDVLTSDQGDPLATISYRVERTGDGAAVASFATLSVQQQNAFAFYGNKELCAEVHVSSEDQESVAQQQFEPLLKGLAVNPAYTPTAVELAALGSILYRTMRDYKGAAVYYERALTVLLPAKNPSDVEFSRFVTDQLAMSYGIAGDLKRSREVNQAAIARDPDYPLYYYNLACADAEAGNALAAQEHLRQAFARRANTLKGEHMPDPASDDSIMKLKRNQQFWSFVQSLPRS